MIGGDDSVLLSVEKKDRGGDFFDEALGGEGFFEEDREGEVGCGKDRTESRFEGRSLPNGVEGGVSKVKTCRYLCSYFDIEISLLRLSVD